ncbi:MAG TPA: presqualene diphosphate synthase HpnD [Bacteroidota bacterium]|nr:presqualene diphosphate synthase HpnD [Bacteroidota bacterium]
MAAHTVDMVLPELGITRKSNFLLPILFLPPPKREAIETIYAFCRYSDDIVDEEADVKEKYHRLLVWTNELQRALQGVSRFAVLNRLVSVIQKFHIPTHHFLDLLKGMEMDLVKSRYSTFKELELYCYRAASTVGLICAEVFGYHHERTKQYAVNLGIALQLTNILRDIKADAKKGRIYLPKEDLERFGYTEEELMNSVYNDRFRALMRFECERAHEYYRSAKSCLAEDDKALFTAARAMGNIYYLLLLRIERAQYDVFTRRIRLGSPVKFLVAMILRLRNKLPKNFHRYIRTELPA